MRRREFIAVFGGIAAWPLATRAQQVDRVRLIGMLLPTNENDPEYPILIDAFIQGLAQAG
jgi:putative ABC transport system substrate-binding protein